MKKFLSMIALFAMLLPAVWSQDNHIDTIRSCSFRTAIRATVSY